MSTNEDDAERFGYGVDLKVDFDKDGFIDLALSETGDIDTVGGDGEANRDVKIQNVLQQMKLILMTPAGTLLDENGNPRPYGSNLLFMIGQKLNDFNILVIKSYVLSSLLTLDFIDTIQNIVIVPDEKKKDSLKVIGIYFTLKDDTQKFYTEFEVIS